jgi:hypothetical protein
MTSQVLEGAILAIGIAYVKVSPFLPVVKTHTHLPIAPFFSNRLSTV